MGPSVLMSVALGPLVCQSIVHLSVHWAIGPLIHQFAFSGFSGHDEQHFAQLSLANKLEFLPHAITVTYHEMMVSVFQSLA